MSSPMKWYYLYEDIHTQINFLTKPNPSYVLGILLALATDFFVFHQEEKFAPQELINPLQVHQEVKVALLPAPQELT